MTINQLLKDFVIISVLNKEDSLENAHKDIELIYVIKGRLQVCVEKKEYDLGRSDFLLINSNELHSFTSNEENLFILFQLDYIKLSELLAQSKLLFTCNTIERPLIQDLELRKVMEELISVYLKQSNNLQVGFLSKVFKLISILEAYYLTNKNALEMKNKLYGDDSNNRLSDIKEYIQAHYRNFLTLEGVASAHYLSSPYLSRLFKNKTGMTFSRYLNEIRLAHAVDELINSDYSITRIALDNGFPNLAAFNRVFNDYYKMKPGQFRKHYFKQIMQPQKVETELVIEKNDEVLTELREYLEVENGEVKPGKKQLAYIDRNIDVYKKNWGNIINIGYAKDILSSDMQEQIKLMQSDIGFRYARFWGIFSDEMNVEDSSEDELTYNFNNVNKLLDFLIKNNLKPFIELGPKPKIISKSIEKAINVQISRRRNVEEWKNLIKTFLLHCMERYGVDEVETWYFELWNPYIDPIRNEQNIVNNDRNTNTFLINEGKYKKYFELFGVLRNDIKELVPLAKVGGCGLTLDVTEDILVSFIKQWYTEDVHPDFLSAYLYPIEMESREQHGSKRNLQSANPIFVQNKLSKLREILSNTGFSNLELNVTEWNISVSNRDYLHDSCFKASYIVKNILDNIKENQVNMIGYWLFSDIFSDFKDSKNILHGGAGLITKSGIKKPSYHAFVLLKQLGNSIVAKGDNFIVTKKSGDRYQVLCFNYKHFKNSYYLHPDASVGINEQYDIFEDNDSLPFTLEIKGIPNGRYRIKEHKQNRKHGSILDEWLKFGAVTDMKQDEVDFLKQICIPDMKVQHIIIEENTIVIERELEPHEVRLFEIHMLLGNK
ncbi:GH39 family glycosyl hydrolase [Bacillus sp. B1-b2]|uniref:GH39 family glycosyl hydrolase n=1 Tax=Bacillus sp. B1-b2 TaxID=2653201 RepID=UPI001D01A06E|nr:helix-turn-helix domain-containing protein [Bacillus sp. B1-b2]